jgi:hypothetical protein
VLALPLRGRTASEAEPAIIAQHASGHLPHLFWRKPLCVAAPACVASERGETARATLPPGGPSYGYSSPASDCNFRGVRGLVDMFDSFSNTGESARGPTPVPFEPVNSDVGAVNCAPQHPLRGLLPLHGPLRGPGSCGKAVYTSPTFKGATAVGATNGACGEPDPLSRAFDPGGDHAPSATCYELRDSARLSGVDKIYTDVDATSASELRPKALIPASPRDSAEDSEARAVPADIMTRGLHWAGGRLKFRAPGLESAPVKTTVYQQPVQQSATGYLYPVTAPEAFTARAAMAVTPTAVVGEREHLLPWAHFTFTAATESQQQRGQQQRGQQQRGQQRHGQQQLQATCGEPSSDGPWVQRVLPDCPSTKLQSAWELQSFLSHAASIACYHVLRGLLATKAPNVLEVPDYQAPPAVIKMTPAFFFPAEELPASQPERTALFHMLRGLLATEAAKALEAYQALPDVTVMKPACRPYLRLYDERLWRSPERPIPAS